jgi:2,3-bisphosphoglycerate-dependent phosphoglycerate mutase
MEILIVRHGESAGNAEGRMQGTQDFLLSERGREQARRLARWLNANAIRWDVAYSSPLGRATETAALLAELTGHPVAELEPDLAELRAGALEGLTRDEIAERFPAFLQRGVTELGDFSEFGGEGYDEVQLRARRLFEKLEREQRAAERRVLLVGHGGINFQLLKILICVPVPRVCIVRMGNCSATLVRMRDRRGSYMGEVVWHVPVELMGGETDEGAGSLFR